MPDLTAITIPDPVRSMAGSQPIVYRTDPVAGPLHLHVWQPDRSETGNGPPTPRPAVVFYHGGGWRHGHPDMLSPQCCVLAQLGLVAISVQYRLVGAAADSPLDCLSDARDAFRYVRENVSALGIDPTRIAAGGGSAGGYLAVGLITLNHPDMPIPLTHDPATWRPDALILLNPVLNTTPDGGYGSQLLTPHDHAASPMHHVPPGLPTPEAPPNPGAPAQSLPPGAWSPP